MNNLRNSVRLIRILIIVIIIVAACSASLPFLIEPVNGAFIPPDYQQAAALTNFFAFIGLGAALIFALSLNGFKTDFKKAYYFICAGLIFHGLSVMVFPTLLLYTPLFWTDLPNLLGDAPYFIGTILVFMGLLRFMKLLSLKTPLEHIYITIPIALIIMFAGWLVPHGPYLFSEIRFDLVKSPLWLEPLFAAFCLPILWKLRLNASLVYKRPLTWLFVATICDILAGIVYGANSYLQLPIEQSALVLNVVGALYALTQLIFLVAGYSFSRITRNQPTTQEGTTIDVITYVAGLASQPKDVDQLLDPLRQLTSSLAMDKELDTATKARLAAIYESIEEYLITKETLRSFTREDLRRDIQNRFSPDAYAPLFKPVLTI